MKLGKIKGKKTREEDGNNNTIILKY